MKLQLAICLLGICLIAAASAGNPQKSKDRRPVKSIESQTSTGIENNRDNNNNDSDLVKKSWKKVFPTKYDDTEEIEGDSRFYEHRTPEAYPAQPQQPLASQSQPQAQPQTSQQSQPSTPSHPIPPPTSNYPNDVTLQCVCTPVTGGYPYPQPTYPQYPQIPQYPQFPFPSGPYPSGPYTSSW